MNSIQNNCITLGTQDAQSHVWSTITFIHIFFTVFTGLYMWLLVKVKAVIVFQLRFLVIETVWGFSAE